MIRRPPRSTQSGSSAASDVYKRQVMQRIAGERFATMADIYRLTGELPEDADPYPAADLRGKTKQESAARLARMLGRDASEAGLPVWVDVARYVAACQLAQIEAAARELIVREDPVSYTHLRAHE